MTECHHSAWRTIAIIITTVIVTLFLEAALVFGYVWVKNPFGIRDLIRPGQPERAEPVTDAHPLLTDEQEQLLRTVGIDAGQLPTELTPELKTCLIEKVGTERIEALKGGAQPTLQDLLDAKPCVTQ